MSPTPATIIQTAEIPPIPAVLQQILALAENPNASSSDLERLVSQEPALVTQLLKWVNSAYYALKQRVTSISHAMILLGFSTVKSLASGLMLINAFDQVAKEDQIYFNRIWEHALIAANFSKIFAQRESQPKQDTYFLAGMIHDVGHIVLKQYFKKRYDALIKNTDYPTLEDEKKILGVTHVEIGYELLKHWLFSEDVIALVGSHHTPDLYTGSRKDIAFLFASDVLAYQQKPEDFFELEEKNVPKEFLQEIEIFGWNWNLLKGKKQTFIDAHEMTKRLFRTA